MTREELALLMIENCLDIIIPKTVNIPEGELYYFDDLVEGTWYEKLVLPEGIEKPLLQDFEQSFEEYKAQILAVIVEEERQTILNEFIKIYEKDSGFLSLRKIFPEISNPLLWINENKMTSQELTDILTQVNSAEASSNSETQINELYLQMNKDVLAQMTSVFGTTNPDSASAYEGTYKLMVSKSSIFVGKLGFTTEEDVITYAQQKITAIENYAVWRMERIAQFRAARDIILNA